MVNLQQIEKQDLDQNGRLDVIQVFKTIQGEGPFAGCPAIFVRLAGCNLQCPLCDTLYTGPGRHDRMPPDNLHQIVRSMRTVEGLVVITGGEPFRQNISPFVRLLIADHYKVQIETNGTLSLDDFPYYVTSVVCSPKTPVVNPNLLRQVTAWKYIVEAGFTDPEDGLPTRVLGKNCRVARPPSFVNRENIFVQPCDDGDRNKLHQDEAVRVCMKFGYRICVQQHKILGLE